ncbi:hypothetical protein [Streptomyces sp. AS02]|uniref:hypothetical protein n=1 Tax=Streptomyces sp. AS02 TaxID=2938946 RepID=UPI00202098C6|nr:hypothetical protein [Streptomyces sp. AS02]MCL8017848.1 hypothetical protein [Streptomyces sp. AS02]
MESAGSYCYSLLEIVNEVLDFGNARAADGTSVTRPGVMTGPPLGFALEGGVAAVLSRAYWLSPRETVGVRG